MNTLDYSTYSNAELLQAKSSINSEAHPENYKALIEEINRRDFKKDATKEQATNLKKSLTRVKVVGWFQIVSALVLAITVLYLTIQNKVPAIAIGMFFLLAIFNAVAGYTALKRLHKWYWLSIVNQGLQVISFALGKLIYSYNALGGIFVFFSTENGLNIGFNASLNPNAQFYYLAEPISNPTINIDIVAIILISALITAYKFHSSDDQLSSSEKPK